MRARGMVIAAGMTSMALGLILAACGSPEGGQCREGVTRACVCADDSVGEQLCSDGEFGACVCEGPDAGTDAGGGGTDAGTDAGGGGTDSGMRTDAGTVMSMYVGMVPSASSVWGDHPDSGGMTGLMAGDAICAAANPGAMDVHVCHYHEVLEAEAAGELAGLAPGTTFWIHRTTTADVAGAPSAPGPGGTCADWTYATNHIADGEFGEVGADGTITYNLDNDTFYDGVDTSHAQPGFNCGGATRAILCCIPETVMSPG